MIGGGVPRTPNPIERRAIQRPAQAQRQSEGGQVPYSDQAPEPRPSYQPPRNNTPDPKPARQNSVFKKIILVVVIAVLLIGLVGVAYWVSTVKKPSLLADVIDSDKYQTVFFVNGQEYFGSLEIIDDNYFKLTNVFYVQAGSGDDLQSADTEDGQSVEGTANNSQLIKLGNEINGPEDAMIISRDQVLFFVNMKPGAQVSKLIDQYQAGGS